MREKWNPFLNTFLLLNPQDVSSKVSPIFPFPWFLLRAAQPMPAAA